MIDYSLRSCVERGVSVRRCKNSDRWFPQTSRVTDEQFYAWSEKAREEKKKCDRVVISPEEFQQWLRDSKI